MDDGHVGANGDRETPAGARRNGRELVVLDDALSELARIGAEGVPGIRVVSAGVEGRAAVRLAVDVECSKSPSQRRPLSEIVEEVSHQAKTNIGGHLPGREHTRVNVTIASVCRARGNLKDRARGLWNENVGFLKGELGPWIVPLLVLGFGVFILWVITKLINEPETKVGDVVLVLLLVTPILIYAIVSGKLTELKGPGGVEAKFSAQAAMPVATTASHDSVSIDELLTVPAGTGQQQLGKRVQRFTEIQPIVMTVTIGAPSFGEGEEEEHIRGLRAYVAQLSRSRNFALVAFLDVRGDFVAYMPSWVVKNRLDNKEKAEELFTVLKQADQQKLFEYPGILRDKVSPNATNGEALRKMVESNLNIIVVVDENNRLRGVLEREQVLSKMVLTLTPNN